MIATVDLPDDIDGLKAIILAQQEQNAIHEGVIARKEDRIVQLEKLVADDKRAMFGARSEKACAEQFELALENIEAAQEAVHAEDEADDRQVSGKPRPRKTNRGSLPKHLPRIEEIIAPENTTCECGHERHVIGEDVSERLDVVPAQFRAIVTRRPRYACRSCESGILQSPAPVHLLPGGMPTEATLAAWVGRAAFELKPVYDALMANLKRSTKLFMDQTTAPVLDPGMRKTKTGYFWALARDDRPWDCNAPPGAAFTYAPGRSGQYADKILSGCSGVLQVDGYEGYNQLLKRPSMDVTLAYCWAHARRKLHEVSQTGTTPIADEGLKQIGKLYCIEKDIRGLSPDTRRAARRERSKPIIEAFQVWLTANRARVSGKSPIVEALKYIAKYWDGLMLFLDDGRIEMDSNAVERTIRPITLNRKNALFAGHDAGAQNWAMIASLIETCKLNPSILMPG